MSSSVSRTAFAPPPTDHRSLLFVLSCTTSFFTLALTVVAAQLPLFDSSPKVLLRPWTEPTSFAGSLRRTLAAAALRWDTFHFAHIAQEGYVYEHEWAFFPVAPSLMRSLGGLLRSWTPRLGSSDLELEDILLGGMLGSMLSVHSVLTLYDLTLELLGSPNVALLGSLLSLLPSSPVTLRLAGYSEAIFTWCSYSGMLYCARRQWLFGAFCFTVAATARSNGIFLCGFLLYGLVVEPVLDHRKVRPSPAFPPQAFKLNFTVGPQLYVGRTLLAFALSAMILSPFLYLQYGAYRVFCLGDSKQAPWCDAFPPSIYAYVQSQYWNGGVLRYWTPQQLPNFLLGAPPLALLFAYSLHYLRGTFIPRLQALVSSPSSNPRSSLDKSQESDDDAGAPPSASTPSPFLHPSLAPHAVHALIMALLLLFASHTQIVLRVAASMPCIYWAAAWLLVEQPALGRWWVGWSVVWGAVSCMLWAAFLPPA
ncbi:mannosyltransferase [Ganoderma leucocontextum]|nr:mannosyltransferase [Ganoderma leucocontextum]